MTKLLVAVALTTVFPSLASSVAQAANEDIVTIESRLGVTVGFVVTDPANSTKATALLFTGGQGKLKLWKGRGLRSKNFLVRSRQLFAE